MTVMTRALLVPPLEQPTLPLLPAGVCTVTLKLPGAGIMEELMVTVTWELLFTAVTRVAPLKTTTEEENELAACRGEYETGGQL